MCVYISQIFKVNPSWDLANIYKIAIDVATKGSTEFYYLYTYPNNVEITIIYCIVFKICQLFKLTDYLTIATTFNAVIVALTGILIYLITKKIFGKKKALMLAIILLFTTPLYLYTAIFYTDTLSMFICTLIVYSFLIVKSNNKNPITAKKLRTLHRFRN